MLWLAPASGAFALPVIVGLVTGTTLELPTRNASRPAVPAPVAK